MTTRDAAATPAAIDALVEHRQRFLVFVRKRVQDPDVAEEILQGAYAKALTHAEDIRDDERGAGGGVPGGANPHNHPQAHADNEKHTPPRRNKTQHPPAPPPRPDKAPDQTPGPPQQQI